MGDSLLYFFSISPFHFLCLFSCKIIKGLTSVTLLSTHDCQIFLKLSLNWILIKNIKSNDGIYSRLSFFIYFLLNELLNTVEISTMQNNWLKQQIMNNKSLRAQNIQMDKYWPMNLKTRLHWLKKKPLFWLPGTI